jgi:hypothetical protein
VLSRSCERSCAEKRVEHLRGSIDIAAPCRCLYQRPDGLGRPACRQSHAFADVRGRGRWRHDLGGGRGGSLGTVFGAYILMMVVNILLVLNVSAYYSTIAEGLILILAVLAGSLSRASPLARHMRRLFVRTRARRDGLLPGQRSREAHLLRLPDLSHSHARRGAATPGWLTRHADTLRFAVPAYVCLVLVLLVTQVTLGYSLTSWSYFNSLIVLSSFLAVLVGRRAAAYGAADAARWHHASLCHPRHPLLRGCPCCSDGTARAAGLNSGVPHAHAHPHILD